MDAPIPFWRRDGIIDPRKPHCLLDELDNALDLDDKDEFLRLIKDPHFKNYRHFFGAGWVFRHDALNCCIAVLNGETRGIIDIKMEQGFTPLHLAALQSSYKLTKYLLERGDSVDVHFDFANLKLKQATPIDIILEKLSSGLLVIRTWTPHKSVYELLVLLCQIMRRDVEIIRMLVRNTQNKERVWQTFMDYADKRQLVPIALLFFAAPELFLSSYSVAPEVPCSSIATLHHVFNSLEKRTDDEEAMSLLIDALLVAGPKFVAYTRLQYQNDQAFLRSYLDVAFLVREVAYNKQGFSSSDDYFLRFFKPMRPVADQLRNIPRKKEVPRPQPLPIRWPNDDTASLEALPFKLKRNDLDQAYINRVFPSLTTEDADCLNNAIEKKLSLMPTLYGRLEDLIRTPNQGVKFPVQGSPFPFSRAKYWPDFRNTPTNSWRNKEMKLTKPYSTFSQLKVLQFVNNIAKRLIK